LPSSTIDEEDQAHHQESDSYRHLTREEEDKGSDNEQRTPDTPTRSVPDQREHLTPPNSRQSS